MFTARFGLNPYVTRMFHLPWFIIDIVTVKQYNSNSKAEMRSVLCVRCVGVLKSAKYA